MKLVFLFLQYKFILIILRLLLAIYLYTLCVITFILCRPVPVKAVNFRELWPPVVLENWLQEKLGAYFLPYPGLVFQRHPYLLTNLTFYNWYGEYLLVTYCCSNY